MSKIKKHINKIIISIIILFICIPLLKYWYIFWLDQVLNVYYTPKIWSNIYLISKIIYFFKLNNIDIYIIEKIIILATFILPVIWMYLLQKNNTKNKIYLLIPLIFIIINPFLYYRFIDWQINIYLSYALYPLFFYFTKKYFNNLTIKNWFIIAIYTLLLCLTSLHNTFFIFIILIFFAITYFFKYKNIWYLFKLSQTFIIIILINLTWLYPLILNNSNNKFALYNEITQINNKSIKVFQNLNKDKNIYIENLSLKWYWWLYKYNEPNTQYLIYILLFIIFIWLTYKYKKWFTYFEKSLISIAIISYILSLGISQNNIFSPISDFLYKTIDQYKWLREPNKWLIFVAIFYSYFLTFWFKNIIEIIKKISNNKVPQIIWIIFILLLPIFYTKEYFLNLHKEIVIKEYPKEWLEIKNEIFNLEWNKKNINCKYKWKKTNSCYNVLVLPWHKYIYIDWIWKVVWTWITDYFWHNILYWDNVEMKTLYTESKRIESKIIENHIWPKWILNNIKYIKKPIEKEKLINFINNLKWLWIKYIIFLKESDYSLYENIFNNLQEKKLINIKKENTKIILYKIKY